MSVMQILVNKRSYDKRLGQFTKHAIISEYSVSIDRQVTYDRSNARYLCGENIRDRVNFDLAVGLESFIDKGELLQTEPCLYPLYRWAIGQPGATVKEVFGDADFASWRGTMKRIAETLINYNPNHPKSQNAWTVIAQDFGGVILISEDSKTYGNNQYDLATYSGFKFEQYMSADAPDGRPNTDIAVDNRPTFEMMVRTDLVVGRDSLKLCCGAEIDALRGEEPIEFKTAWEENENGFFRNISTVMQSDIVGVRSIVVGIKKGDIMKGEVVVDKVIEKKVVEIKSEKNIGLVSAQCYSFLFTVLTEVGKFLVANEACEVSFDPIQGVVEIKSISRQNANDGGNGVTEEFIRRFNL